MDDVVQPGFGQVNDMSGEIAQLKAMLAGEVERGNTALQRVQALEADAAENARLWAAREGRLVQHVNQLQGELGTLRDSMQRQIDEANERHRAAAAQVTLAEDARNAALVQMATMAGAANSQVDALLAQLEPLTATKQRAG
jgi:hypothetical protein